MILYRYVFLRCIKHIISYLNVILIFLTLFLFSFLQARQILEREFNNLLAMGTDRRLEEVGM